MKVKLQENSQGTFTAILTSCERIVMMVPGKNEVEALRNLADKLEEKLNNV